MEVDYIIVGLGLAGIAFAENLAANNKRFVVFEDSSQNSSLVAAGAYNPVILKRFTPVWNGDAQLEFALPFYHSIETKLNQVLDTKVKTIKIFNSAGDENNWFSASDKPTLSKYMQPTISREKIEGVDVKFGYGELKGTGWIDTQKLIKNYKLYLEKHQQLITDTFDYAQLTIDESKVQYNDIIAKNIVFCEGYGIVKNPFFNHLPLNGTKGEKMIIKAPDLHIDFQIKSTVFILPLGNNLYKVGATFNWTDKTLHTTKEGRDELIEKLKRILTVPFEVVSQSAGIRPTVKDRRPLVGLHSKYKNIAVLNGLGTRGVMIAPTVAHNLYQHIENDIPLDKEISIARFR